MKMTEILNGAAPDLTESEIDAVSGGRLNWTEGASMIAGLSMFSPVTMAFGLPIAGAMLIVDYYSQ
jgi:hypothetical protein